MDELIVFLQQYGLTGIALGGAWFLIRYYVGNDIAATKSGIAANKEAHDKLKKYVEDCESEVERRFLQMENEMKISKVEQATGLALIQTSLSNISTTLTEHIRVEGIYQDKIDKFMGYAYRKLGNGHPTEE